MRATSPFELAFVVENQVCLTTILVFCSLGSRSVSALVLGSCFFLALCVFVRPCFASFLLLLGSLLFVVCCGIHHVDRERKGDFVFSIQKLCGVGVSIQNVCESFQLELDIANYRQGDLSIQNYYFGFLNMWVEHLAILHAGVSADSIIVVQKIYEVSKRNQFTMKPQPEIKQCVHLC